jgi:hypothetical protein
VIDQNSSAGGGVKNTSAAHAAPLTPIRFRGLEGGVKNSLLFWFWLQKLHQILQLVRLINWL